MHKLRQEKDVLESKLKEFERSLQKLKDCTYQEATQKREYERRVQSVQADLRGANLREQVCYAVPLLMLWVCYLAAHQIQENFPTETSLQLVSWT